MNASTPVNRLADEASRPAEEPRYGAEPPAPTVSTMFGSNEASPFSTTYRCPPIPIAAAFVGPKFHQCRSKGRWDLTRAAAENAALLMRSSRVLWPDKPTNDNGNWDDVIFQYGPQAFLHVEQGMVTGYSLFPSEAEKLVVDFAAKYQLPEEPSGGSFELIRTSEHDISTESVPLKSTTVLEDEALSLHYGGGFLEWHQQYVDRLLQRDSGISILEGPPGTGKTSYLRHLMGILKDTHRFYFVPPGTMSVLSRPEFIGFWAVQRRRYAERKFAVILEDSDDAIMTRGQDNSEHVSALLNLSDGMLASFLQLQLICTINCGTADIDQALLRPGRLISQRVFSRLEYPAALRLAKSLGRTLPVARDYSLAEIFAEPDLEEVGRPKIGFAA